MHLDLSKKKLQFFTVILSVDAKKVKQLACPPFQLPMSSLACSDI